MAFTYFFRDLQTLEAIRDHVLPNLKTKKYIDIWDAGCAMGQEPYSLSMILNESMGHMFFRNVRILATDIDESNRFEEIIANAVYPEELTQRIPKGIFNRYFNPCDENKNYQLNETIRKSVEYKRHDLLSLVPPRKEFGLIMCKNVLLHFDDSQRMDVLRMFHDALSDDGYLAMEQTQKLPDEAKGLFEPVLSNAQVFKKTSAAAN
jgi:chemotaxis protein methyltransferase CheR